MGLYQYGKVHIFWLESCLQDGLFPMASSPSCEQSCGHPAEMDSLEAWRISEKPIIVRVW